MRTTVTVMVSTLAILIWTSSNHANADHIFSFDAGPEGWSSPDTNTTWQPAGGNPGGYMRKDDNGYRPVDDVHIYAPPTILGDWSSFDGGTLEYDHNLFSTGDVANFIPYIVRLDGPGGQAEWVGDTTTGAPGWITQTVPISETSWSVNSGSWAALMSNVTEFRIVIELVTNSGAIGDITGIDNIKLTGVPEPSSALLALFAVAGWSTVAIRRKRYHPR